MKLIQEYTKRDWLKFWNNYKPPSYDKALSQANLMWILFYIQYKNDPRIKPENRFKPKGGQKQSVIDQLATALNSEGSLLIGDVGSGKTIVYGFLLYILKHSKYFHYLNLLHPTEHARIPFAIVTRTGVVIQTKRELLRHWNLKCLVIGYPALRSSFGKSLFIEFKTIISNGDPQIIPKWNTEHAPLLILWDECQSLKNARSMQTEIMRMYSLQTSTKAFRSIFVSATPWEKSGESVSSIIGMRIKLALDFDGNRILDWKDNKAYVPITPKDVKQTDALAQSIIGVNLSLEAKSPTANDRIQHALSYNIIRIKNMRYEFKGTIRPRLITPTANQLEAYKVAYAEYQKSREKRGWGQLEGMAAELVALLKFRQKSELLRSPNLSKMLLEARDKGLTPACASNFLMTLRVVHVHLTRAGIPESQIASIVGGQSMIERQKMIDKYQDGTCKFMLFSLGAGGAGLSLHHDSDLTTPRYGCIPVPWSAIELIQGLGRLHRLTSKSPTLQEVCLFEGTVEESVVYPILEKKRNCIAELVKSKTEFTSAWTSRQGDNIGDDLTEHYKKHEKAEESFDDDDFNINDMIGE